MLLPEFFVFQRSMCKQHNLTQMNIYRSLFNNNFKNDSFEALILKNTVTSVNHLTPELKLRLITPECELWHCKGTESKFPNDPFWGIYWPGGQALGRYILDNKVMFQQKTVLDIGSGSGACALAAAKSGAKFVLANDIDPVSMSAVRINSRLNNLEVHTYDHDLIGKDIDLLPIKRDNEELQLEWNVILIGDMFYDTDFSLKLFAWLSKLVEKNKLVLIGDPGRHALKELEVMKNSAFVEKIAEYCLLNKEHNGFSSSSVFKTMYMMMKIWDQAQFLFTPYTPGGCDFTSLGIFSKFKGDLNVEYLCLNYFNKYVCFSV